MTHTWRRTVTLCCAIVIFAVVAPAHGQTPRASAPCGFALTGSGTTPQISGPAELSRLLTVVPQPDSPLEITAVDLTNMRLRIGESSWLEERGSEYAVSFRNRSNQTVYGVLGIVGVATPGRPGITGAGWKWKGTLSPGETVRQVVRSGAGSGTGTDSEKTRLSAEIGRVTFKDCVYMPSLSGTTAYVTKERELTSAPGADSSPCSFRVSPNSSAPDVVGPDELTSRLRFVSQPDSPVDFVAVDLRKIVAHIADSAYQIERPAEYSVTLRNRSDQPIVEVDGIVGFRISQPGEGGAGWTWRGALQPGGTVHVVTKWGGGYAIRPQGNSGTEVTLSAVISEVRFKDCWYRPSRTYANPITR